MVFPRAAYLKHCYECAKNHRVVAIVTAVIALYSGISSAAPLIGNIPPPVLCFIMGLPKIPWQLAAMVVLASVAFIAVEGGYRLRATDRKAAEGILTHRIAEKEAEIERLTAEKSELEWPANRPKITFRGWGNVRLEDLPEDHNPAMLFQKGFYLNNDGGVALEIKIDDFLVGETAATSKTISRIEGSSQGFTPIWMETSSLVFRWDLLTALGTAAVAEIDFHKMKWGEEYRIPLRATYRDFSNIWYSSEAPLIFYHKYSRIEFGPVVQRLIGYKKPE